ncbi:sugar ABC transporter permease [Paenibacillus sp. SSG-1]|uniref:ABC transporter permease n=1 Tax=Paenibacillus cineris TaxID=237530 RepID=A0ABQ4LDS7_9BACL|nr:MULTISPECIES: carbohydrate ABC transporter permease [Paenibacillus]OXL84164.1 sugar ABC transporter permease [Paenibacillus sp. SSG-1]PQP88363.1 carbohydrate ABC transporter permease [Paenibacillus sp. AR247]UYO02288.1 carbohydrate ABC transporter permease [Paenibacillus sp. PSB04]GIO54712.1 ABC transporter permease [Paenibacillus cineris]GIO59577.1 ABC transporter permease [Paenibacillus cineris]
MRRTRIEQVVIHFIFWLIVAFCLVPFLLLITASFTDEDAIIREGYSFFPSEWSLDSYVFIFQKSGEILNSYGISVVVTILGTLASLVLMTLLAYPLSKKDLPLRNFFSFIVFFTMLFNGGLVPTYLIYSNVFHITNTLLALIVPGLLVSAFYVILLRTFFTVSVPEAVLESANMDGAGEFRIFVQMALPLSLPVLATVGLFQVINYWNDWFNGLIYISDSRLYSIQVLLNTILLNVQYLLDNVDYSSRVDGSSIPTQGVRLAIAVIGALPIVLTYPFFQRFFVKGLTVGAVKG